MKDEKYLIFIKNNKNLLIILLLNHFKHKIKNIVKQLNDKNYEIYENANNCCLKFAQIFNIFRSDETLISGHFLVDQKSRTRVLYVWKVVPKQRFRLFYKY